MSKKAFDESIVLQCTNLILNDFEKLINLLYRIDVDESKLKQLLSTHENEDAAKIISATIIDRQLQKIHLRRSMQPGGKSDEEKW